MAENMCRTATDMIVPPGHGAVVVSELPAAGKEGIYYIVDGDPVGLYTWDGTQFVSACEGGGPSLSLLQKDAPDASLYTNQYSDEVLTSLNRLIGGIVYNGETITGNDFDDLVYGSNDIKFVAIVRHSTDESQYDATIGGYASIISADIQHSYHQYQEGDTIYYELTVIYNGACASTNVAATVYEGGD